MTVSTATPPVFLHPLADRNGSPAALLFDAALLPAGAAQPPMNLLEELASGGMGCYYRAGASQELNQALAQAGWKVLLDDKFQRAGDALPRDLPPSVQWIAGDWFLAPPAKAVGTQAASRALALQLVQLVSADADTHEIEALLRQDPTLSYHLLRLVNSLGMGTGRRVTSFSQAILILGRSQLRRWLNLMLFSSREGDPRSAMLLARVAVRARSMELLSKACGHDKHHQEQAFMVGMFSLLGVLFGMPLDEVLKPLTISEAVQLALLSRQGELGQLLCVVEAAEQADHAALAGSLRALQVDTDTYNRIAVDAHLWMQSVTAGKAGSPHA
ncbi:EAL and modified HD-GYP domain-containing signal transduction protein [Duganella sp. SG902]|uniref:EAL and HDOD domain-containing protein n=1 Tax=Duganella sp. SG902 TaxID=2587016 RepID=UPI00159E70B8|nr:HDOD domain-containing protein [Duganella sp. SG902]NVM74710.1 EAL and modified HD-GYP domain-containing signal transduction protein [Duganella sp. SG902]